MKIKFTIVTNTKGTLNKTFYLDNQGNVKKESNAFLSEGNAQTYQVNSLTEFHNVLEKLTYQQAIIIGITENGEYIHKIVTKGQEKPPFVIPRTNKYLKYPIPYSILLGDYDPDVQMPTHMVINTPQEFYNTLLKIMPEGFKKVECLIGYGSSYGIKNKNAELVYNSNSFHAYWVNKNASEETINNLIEYIKRECIKHGLYYLKIHKDGSASLRYSIDLSVLKSASSRLCFEAKPICKDGLYQDRPQSFIFNKDSQETLDLTKVFYENLPNWEPIYSQLKIEKQDLIQKQKESYKLSKINELISHGLTKETATEIVTKQIEENVLSVKTMVMVNNTPTAIIKLLTQANQCFYITDPIEPEKGNNKAILYTNYFFNPYIYTHLHGGKKYLSSFEEDDISNILTYHKENVHLEKVIEELAIYLVNSKKNKRFVRNISTMIFNITKDDELQKHFENHYDIKHLEKKAFKYMENYALIKAGGKVGFIDKSKTIIELYTRHDLKISLDNKKLTTIFSKKIYNPVDIFTQSKNREDYDVIVFKDPKKVKSNEYNLFKGFKYAPIKTIDTNPFWNFVKEVIANNDNTIYSVICAWMAQLIQNPFSKMGTALVIIGEKGCGKGTFVSTLGALIGEYYMESSDPKRIFSNFNAHLQNCLLLYANEAFWSGQKADESKLKSLVTDIDFVYEIKGSLTYKGENFTHIILDSNSPHVVYTTVDERRWITTTASSIYRGNFEYFEELHKLVKQKAFRESLLYDLMNFNYTPWERDLRKAPVTEAMIDQLLHSLDLYEQWWYQVLEEGKFKNQQYTLDTNSTIRIANEAIHESFKSFIKENGKKSYDSAATFTKTIKKKFLPNELIIKETIKSHDGKNAKIIASLDICREYFKNTYGLEIKSAINEWQSYMPQY